MADWKLLTPSLGFCVSVINVLNVSATVRGELRGVVLCCFIRASEAET